MFPLTQTAPFSPEGGACDPDPGLGGFPPAPISLTHSPWSLGASLSGLESL